MAFRLSFLRRVTRVRQIATRLGDIGSGSGKAGVAKGITDVRHLSSGMGDHGSGSGKGSGGAGSIREAGGAFAKMGEANEEMYFRKMRLLQLKKLKEELDNEVAAHEQRIKEHEESIEKHKKIIEKRKKDQPDNEKQKSGKNKSK
ncbi:uncharacterized protein LOC143290786 [Babylonia areolata]|uniref:uncharacterized protein LOC143290786 n=1 Tax=Babylonia areolata TaxID=304850 RepID=UPI003FD000E5